MRKISQGAADAFKCNYQFHRRNTNVRIDKENLYTEMYLHNHLIARKTITNLCPSSYFMTLAGWPTVTTRERLNTLLQELGLIKHKFYQNKGRQYYTNGVEIREIGSQEVITINL